MDYDMMNIITTPMCEDVLKISGIADYKVVKPNQIGDADIAVLLSETKSTIPKLSIKLNTYSQLYESINKISDKFNSKANSQDIEYIKELINRNSEKKDERKKIKVKVYSNFLKDTVIDMGFTVCDNEYDYVVCPDYLENTVNNEEKMIIIPSHKNVSTNIIDRITQRYDLLERELCMKH
jgi:segregation and condensation protein B